MIVDSHRHFRIWHCGPLAKLNCICYADSIALAGILRPLVVYTGKSSSDIKKFSKEGMTELLGNPRFELQGHSGRRQRQTIGLLFPAPCPIISGFINGILKISGFSALTRVCNLALNLCVGSLHRPSPAGSRMQSLHSAFAQHWMSSCHSLV